MKTAILLKVLILNITLFGLSQKIIAQTPFSTGFEKGFKEGYCYNTKAIYCNPQIIPSIPLPRINESDQNFQDGFNRGFQVGLDLQRLESGSGTISSSGIQYSSIPKYRFNDYIPQTPVDAMISVGMYKESLFQKRVQWVQAGIDNLYDLAYSLLDENGYAKIQNLIVDYGNNIKKRRDLDDFADDRVIVQIANGLKAIEKSIYDEYKIESSNSNKKARTSEYYQLLLKAYDSVNTNPNLTLQLLQSASNLNIESFDFNSLCAQAYENLEQYDNALEYRNKLIESGNLNHKDLQYAILKKVLLLTKMEKDVEGLTNLKNPIFYDADDTLKHIITACETVLHYSQKEYQVALMFANKYLESEKTYGAAKSDIIEIKRIKAASLRELGRYNEALDLINSTIKEDNSTSNPILFVTKGKIYFQLKDYKNAITEFIKTTLLDDKSAESFYYLALCYSKLKQKSKACINIQKAIKLGSSEALNDYPNICK